MTSRLATARRIVVKIGSSTLVSPEGEPQRRVEQPERPVEGELGVVGDDRPATVGLDGDAVGRRERRTAGNDEAGVGRVVLDHLVAQGEVSGKRRHGDVVGRAHPRAVAGHLHRAADARVPLGEVGEVGDVGEGVVGGERRRHPGEVSGHERGPFDPAILPNAIQH